MNISDLYERASTHDWVEATRLLERAGVPTPQQARRACQLASALRRGSSIQASGETWALAQLLLLAGG